MARKSYRIKTDTNPKTTKNVKKTNVSEKKDFTREVHFIVLSMFLATIAGISSTYAIFGTTHKTDDKNFMEVGTLKINYEESNMNKINLINAFPISDEEGMKQEPFEFKINNDGNLDATYKIRIVNDDNVIGKDGCENNLLDLNDIKISVNNETPIILGSLNKSNYVIDEGIITKGESKGYNLKIWITDKAGNSSLNKHYHGKVVVDSVNLNSK